MSLFIVITLKDTDVISFRLVSSLNWLKFAYFPNAISVELRYDFIKIIISNN